MHIAKRKGEGIFKHKKFHWLQEMYVVKQNTCLDLVCKRNQKATLIQSYHDNTLATNEDPDPNFCYGNFGGNEEMIIETGSHWMSDIHAR